jgi:lipopolysaccharide cholinephosphotransferase
MRVSDEDLRRLQLTQLAILVDVDALCERHGIRYVLLGGTALGSRRHRGFIPWDDDIDIGMLRADFERFLEVGRAELPESLYVQYWLDDPHMGAPFAKIRRNGTRFVEASSSETGGHKGVSIDLFPFDNVPDGPAEQPWKAELKFWRRVLRHQTGYSMRRLPLALRLADMPARVMARLVGQARAKQRLHKLMTKYRERNADRVLAVGGAYDFRKDMLKAEWLTDRVPQPFEGREFPCSRDLDAYLTHMYGDFMRLPPPDERRNKHVIVELSFG